MKISELITQLEFLKERGGDCDITLYVKDHYSRYGSPAKFGYNPSSPHSHLWDGTFTNNGSLNIDIHLDSQEGKNPKITFRK